MRDQEYTQPIYHEGALPCKECLEGELTMKSLFAPSLMFFSLLVLVASPTRAQDIDGGLSSPNQSPLSSPSEIDAPAASPTKVPALDAALPAEAFLDEEDMLNPGDLTLSDGSLYKQYVFDGEEGQAITISMASDEFDTYLILVGPEGEMLAQNDDISEADRNSEISITLPETGAYSVIANAYDSSGQGNYSITIRK